MKDHVTKFEELKGVTLASVTNEDNQVLRFTFDDGRNCYLYHSQDCCESVEIEDIAGDLDDLIGSPILLAEVVTSQENPPDAKPETIEYQDSFTWTFYKLATIQGSVTVRWYGSSNGYYSERVDFCGTNGDTRYSWQD